MPPIATHVARSMICGSVCVLAIPVSRAKTDEPIDMPFGGESCERNEAWNAHWRHLANIVERPVSSGDAADCQVKPLGRTQLTLPCPQTAAVGSM